MATFPLLNSGAVAQYPLPMTFQGSADVITFIDGSDQRFIGQQRAMRAWDVQLSLLSETEIQQVDSFFQSVDGQFEIFTFPDPYSGVPIPNCRLGSPDLVSTYLGVDIATTSFWVVETNG